MVEELYLSEDDTKLSEHFMLHEFQSENTDRILLNTDLIPLLEQIHDKFGGKIIITSGYRTPKHSVAVGGGANDQHTQGNAADIMVYDSNDNLVRSADVCCYAEDLGFNGIGHMTNATHLDIASRYWHGDESADGCPNVPDFYSYFGVGRQCVSVEPEPTPTPVAVEGAHEAVWYALINFLCRIPTPDEYDYWLNQLNSGRTFQSMYDEIGTITETREDTFIRKLYLVLLERNPSLDEVAGWRSTPDLDKVTGFMNSDEYTSSH